MKKLLLLMTLVLASYPSYSFEIKEFLGKIPVIGKYFEETKEEKVIVKEIPFPEIPVISSQSKSAEYYELKEKKSPQEKTGQSNVDFVSLLYLQVLKREVSENELKRWLGNLNQGASREGVYRSLVSGEEYISLENTQTDFGSGFDKWATSFFGKYLGLKIKWNNSYNVFLLKRYFSDKALDLMDIWKMTYKNQDLRHWYAHLSHDFALRMKRAKSKSLRFHPSRELHVKWAEKASLDDLKMEVVLKVHALFNMFLP